MFQARRLISLIFCFFIVSCSTTTTAPKLADDHLWLEEIEGARALDFVKTENEKTLNVLKNDPHYKSIESELRAISYAKDRVPWVYQMHGMLYNFWRDQKSVRGIWRRTTLAEYKKAEPKWETVLNLDELAKTENENWVWKGTRCLPHDYERCLLILSRGGKDAVVIREFDVKTKKFVKDGFNIPEAKNHVAWIDLNTIYIGTDHGPDSMTDSGYPRTIQILKRGEKVSDAKTVFEADKKDISADAYVEHSNRGTYQFYTRGLTFYETENWYVKNGEKILIPMPKDAALNGVHHDYLLYTLKSDLKTKKRLFKTGSLVALPLSSVLKKEDPALHLELIFEPTKKTFLQNVIQTKNHLILETIDNIQGKLLKVTFKKPRHWITEKINLGNNGVASIESTEVEHDQFLALYTDFVTPTTLSLANLNNHSVKFEKLKTSPPRFESKDLISEQRFATSKDGERIPYFIVHKKGMKKDGTNPTLLYGYGGFEISIQPFYLSGTGKVWLEKGGVYVLANIRGGGEFGPSWHQAAQKEKHQVVFDDFIAIAEDLIKDKITSPAHLGIQGGSNGGLLTGGTFVQRPDLFNAVLCEVPLLDMYRYNKLLAGASWVDEYGNPDDPAMREIIGKYSPYQNVKPGIQYPEVFFMTSTKDDRVHPGHARRMVAKMRELNLPLFYFENTEGGHGGVANLEQGILWGSLEFTYLWKKLGPKESISKK